MNIKRDEVVCYGTRTDRVRFNEVIRWQDLSGRKFMEQEVCCTRQRIYFKIRIVIFELNWILEKVKKYF